MPDVTELQFVGDWRVIVQSKDAGWDQRVVIDGADAGTQTLAGTVGQQANVYGIDQQPWRLRIQHNDGSGWSENWVRTQPTTTSGSRITQLVESEDITTSGSDRDFNDLVVRLEKIGMVAQPTTPFAVLARTLQVMPEGIFEASLGRYFMAVRVRNIWTQTWPANAVVGLTQRCRQWLAAGGIGIIDAWSPDDQGALGQEVIAGHVVVGSLAAWQSRLIYFKVDVAGAQVRKHNVEVEVLEPAAEDLDHLNRRARALIAVSRTTYDSNNGEFISVSDRGRLIAAIKEIAVDYNTLKVAVARARELFGGQTGPGSLGGAATTMGKPCDAEQLARLRARLRSFLEGKDVDICAIWRELQCCCPIGPGEHEGDDGGDWAGSGITGLEFFAFPTVVDYRIEYAPAFAGQYGPIPFDDPWWKVLLLIIAIILTLAAAVSAAADLANRSSDTVIGTVTRAVLNALATEPTTPPLTTDPGSIDATLATLNGSRGLTAAMFSYLDAAADESNTTPIVSLGGRIDTPGTFLTNAQIDQVFQNLADNPGDTAAQGAVRVFKSGARSGVTAALMSSLAPVSPRGPESDGSTVFFLNQIMFLADPAASVARIGRPGDSGSFWIQRGSNAIVALNHAGCTDPTAMPPVNRAVGSRIEDVVNGLTIRFA